MTRTRPTGHAARIPLVRSAAETTVAEHVARGRGARGDAPRSAHGEFTPARSRPDPLAVLAAQDRDRVPELLPVRYGRMATSPFAFFRGAAAVMAGDLSGTPVTGLDVQLCGDAHVSNFGFFASPERRLVFDIDDFDETLRGPWEWDVKRLVASLEVAGRGSGLGRGQRRDVVLAAVRSYREAMRRFATMPMLDVWYAHIDDRGIRRRYDGAMSGVQRKRMNRALQKMRTKDNLGALARFATEVDGRPRLAADPPLVVPLRDLLPDYEARTGLEQSLHELLHDYRVTLPADRRVLLDAYRVVDVARKVVGVGSVGTRSWMILLTGRDAQDPLFLQAKEAGPSVLETFLGSAPQPQAGQRVVEGQRLMQTAGDIFLGWWRVTGIDGQERDFYVRQLRDWKGSVEVESLAPSGMMMYADLCGWTLARAHARSGDRMAIAAYLGSSATFDEALLHFAAAYADLNERDHRALLGAIAAGRVPATTGV